MTNFSMQETQRILVKCKNSLYCNQPYVKEACRQLFWARDEIVNLRRQVTELERKVVESNHRNLDLQYMVDSDTKTIAELKAALTAYAIDDLSDERLSNRMANHSCKHNWVNMAPNNHMTCSKCGKVKG